MQSARLRMQGLVAASGVHRQTVHFYLRRGLLPPPDEGAGTHEAVYGPRHLELLRLIRELRDRRGLSLGAIRRCFEQAGFDPATVRRATDGGAPAAPALSGSPAWLDERELLARSGASEALLRRLAAAGVLQADPDEAARRFDAEAVAALEAARRLEEGGVCAESLDRLLALAGSLVAVEVGTLIADVTGAGAGSDAGAPFARLAEQRHADIGALLRAARRVAVRGVLRRLAGVGQRARVFAEDMIYEPSAMFIRRYRLAEALRDAEAQATREPGDAEASRRLGRLLIGLGRYAEADLWLIRSAQSDPAAAETHAYLGLARATAGHVVEGVKAARRAVELAPESPRAHAFLGATLALQAAVGGGAPDEDAGEALRRALAVARRSRALREADRRERMEVLLARGRVFTVLPSEAAGHDEGVADLREVLERTGRRGRRRDFDFPGSDALYRMHALFYLGESAHQEGNSEEALRLLRECITLDPASRFATRSFELLAQIEGR